MVTAPNDDWTEELCIRLIHEYKKRPILWDPAEQFFFKKAMKPEAWEGIAAAIGMPAEACKHKMVILQSSFRREKSKIMQNIKTSAENTKFTSSWFAFEEMAFLIDKERKRKTQGNYDSEDGPSDIKKSLLEQFNEKQKQSAVAKKKPTASNVATVLPKPSVSRIKVSENLMPESSPSTERIITVSTPANIPPLTPNPTCKTKHKGEGEDLEEIKSFTNFIAFKMKKYSETTKNSVQQAICDIIFKADQNFYETVHSNNYVNLETAEIVIEDDCDIDEKTIDIGDGHTIKLQMFNRE